MMLADLFESVGFDLTDTFAGDTKNFADFFEGMGHAVFQAKAHFQDFLLVLSKIAGDFIALRLLAQ